MIDWVPGRRGILVITGTDVHPFTRLCAWADDWAGAHPDDDVIVQYGSASAPSRARGLAILTPQELNDLLVGADVVVTHGGPGTISTVRAAGLQPVVLARDPGRGEHVDAHQMRFAAWAAPKGLGTVVWTIEALGTAVDAAAGPMRNEIDPGEQVDVSLAVLRTQLERLLTNGSRRASIPVMNPRRRSAQRDH